MAPKPIITPGPTAKGPPGWEEKQQSRLSSANESVSSAGAPDRNGDSQTGSRQGGAQADDEGRGTLGKLKGALHRMGEKLAFVPPKGSEAGTATQNASTMPEDG